MERQGPWWAIEESPPLHAVIKELIQAKRNANRRERYVDELLRVLKIFCTGREDVPVNSISPSDLEEFIQQRSSTVSTRATLISRFAALFGFAERRGYLSHNPVKRLERIAIDPRPPRILTPAEADELLNITLKHEPQMLAYIVLGLFAGIRSAELDRIKWEDVEIERGFVRIDASASKVRKRRLVTLEPVAVHWLRKVTHFVISPEKKSRRLQVIGWRMGWQTWEHNILRHSAASFLISLHKDAGLVSTMLGNSPAILLSRYTELVSPEDSEQFWAIK